VNAEDAQSTIERLKQLRFVKRVIESPKQSLLALLGLSGNPTTKTDQVKFEEDED
jgi:uncharacterized protein YlbG (UPF0298 family)